MYIIFLISAQNTDEAVLTSNHNPCFEQKYEKSIRNFICKVPVFVVKFSMYLNRRVFVMHAYICMPHYIHLLKTVYWQIFFFFFFFLGFCLDHQRRQYQATTKYKRFTVLLSTYMYFCFFRVNTISMLIVANYSRNQNTLCGKLYT